MLIENQRFDEERALYGSRGLTLKNCAFDGAADGESALKECRDITAENLFCNLRYPFWHDENLKITCTEITDLCRAALWYSSNIEISDSRLHGIKALRECRGVKISGCDINSPEFGWSVTDIEMNGCTVQSEYFMMRSENMKFTDIEMSGKYSFQYIQNAVFDNCIFDTKDAFWHAKNVTVRDSVVKGEYLGWYCENVTFERCKIIGTQPLCYCKGLKLADCEMINTDLCFEKSEVEARITTPIISVKNPISGSIYAPEIGEIIRDDKNSQGVIIEGNKSNGRCCMTGNTMTPNSEL